MARPHTSVENLNIVLIDESSDDYDEDDNYEEYCIPAMESTLIPKQSGLGTHLKCKTDSKSSIKEPKEMCPCKMKLQLQCVNERNHLICKCTTKTKSNTTIVPKQMCLCKKKVLKSNVNNERKRADVLLCGCQNKYPPPLPKFRQIHGRCCCNVASSLNEYPKVHLPIPKVNEAIQIDLGDKSHICEKNSKNESANSEGELWQLVEADGTEVAIGYLKKVKKTNESKRNSEMSEPLNMSTSKSHEEILKFINTLGDEDEPVQEYNWSTYNDPCFILESRSLENSFVSNSKVLHEKNGKEPDAETNPPNPSRLVRSGISYRPKDIESFPSPSEASPFWNSFSNAKLEPLVNEASCDCNTNKYSARVRHTKSKLNSVEFEPSESSLTSTYTKDDPCECDNYEDSERIMHTSSQTNDVKDQVINLLTSPDPVNIRNILFMPIMKETSTQTLLNSDCDTLSTISIATQTSRTLHSHTNLSLKLNQITTTCNDDTSLCYSNCEDSIISESQENEQTSTKPMITQSDIHIFNVSFPNEVEKMEALSINTTKFKRNDLTRSISYSSTSNDDKTFRRELIQNNEPIFSLCDGSANSKEEESPKNNDVMFVAQLSEGLIPFEESELGCENLSVAKSTPNVEHVQNILSAVIRSSDTEM